MSRLLVLAVLAILPGCTLYFGGDDGSGDDGCLGPPAQELRDPQTGTCDAFGGGCGLQGEADPDWGTCGSPCEALDQTSCVTTAGCRAIFADTCPTCDALFVEYFACWPIAPSGPIAGDCAGLDAQACSEHEDCSAVHLGRETANPDGSFANSVGDFEYCQAEVPPTAFLCGDLTCAPGQYCAIRYPGVPDAPIDYACDAIPSGCTGNVCDCLGSAGVCTNGCTVDAAGNPTASCYLP